MCRQSGRAIKQSIYLDVYGSTYNNFEVNWLCRQAVRLGQKWSIYLDVYARPRYNNFELIVQQSPGTVSVCSRRRKRVLCVIQGWEIIRLWIITVTVIYLTNYLPT